MLDLIAFILAPDNQPFAVAAAILGGMLAVEIATLLIGMPLSHKIDAMLDLHADLHADVQAADLHADTHVPVPGHGPHGGGADLHAEAGVFGTVWDWLNAGRVPLLVYLMILIASFAGIGYAAQGIAATIFGFLPPALSCVLASVLAVPFARKATRWISRIVPRDESYVIDGEALIGRVGTITLGPLKVGTIARVRILDAHGNQHFPWVKTQDPALELGDGASVLITARQGQEYLAVSAATNKTNS